MFYFLFSLRRRDDVTIDCGKSALSSRVAVGSPSLINHLLAAYDSLWIRLKDKSSICKHIRMTSTATTNPSDLYQILFHFPIICHHRHRNSLFSAKISLFFFFSSFSSKAQREEDRQGWLLFWYPYVFPHSLSLSPAFPLWCSGVIITLSVEDLTTGQLGHRLGEAPISMLVCYFFPQFIASPFILPDSPTDIRGLLE